MKKSSKKNQNGDDVPDEPEEKADEREPSWQDDEDEWILNEETCVVHKLDNAFEAQAIEDILRDANLPVMVRTFSDPAFDGAFAPGHAWGEVIVLEKNREEAEELIQDYLDSIEAKQFSAEDEEEEAEEEDEEMYGPGKEHNPDNEWDAGDQADFEEEEDR